MKTNLCPTQKLQITNYPLHKTHLAPKIAGALRRVLPPDDSIVCLVLMLLFFIAGTIAADSFFMVSFRQGVWEVCGFVLVVFVFFQPGFRFSICTSALRTDHETNTMGVDCQRACPRFVDRMLVTLWPFPSLLSTRAPLTF